MKYITVKLTEDQRTLIVGALTSEIWLPHEYKRCSNAEIRAKAHARDNYIKRLINSLQLARAKTV